jgi:dihydroorotase
MPGLVDTVTYCGEPGNEVAETIESLAKAARQSGFSTLLLHPMLAGQFAQPESYAHTVAKGAANGITILIAAPLSDNLEGKKLASAGLAFADGASAVSDGYRPQYGLSFVRQALDYLQNSQGPIFIKADIFELSKLAIINEGPQATMLGLSGADPLIEDLLIDALDIFLRDANFSVHVSGISTASAANKILDIKAAGKGITFDVPIHAIMMDDSALGQFETQHKVWPPYRQIVDKLALQTLLIDGKIDIVASHHFPNTEEVKNLEFSEASFGAATIEDTFAALSALPGISASTIVQVCSNSPRQLLNLPINTISEGAPLDFFIYQKGNNSRQNSTRVSLSFAHSLSPSSNQNGYEVLYTAHKGLFTELRNSQTGHLIK